MLYLCKKVEKLPDKEWKRLDKRLDLLLLTPY